MSLNTEPLYPLELSEEVKKFAEEFLNETDEKRETCTKELRSWLDVQENIRASPEDDVILVPFLRSCKYNVDLAKKKIRNYYTMRAKFPQIFSGRDPADPTIAKLLQLGVFVPLRRFHENQLVLIARVGAYNPKEFRLEEVLKMSYMVLDVCNKMCPQMQVKGVYAVLDLTGIGLHHASSLTPALVKHMVHAWENYHCRPKKLHFVNAPSYVNVVLNVFRSFMSQKLQERMRVSSKGCEDLLQFIDASVLPLEYGGSDGCLKEQVDFWSREVSEFADWLDFDEQFRAVLK